VQLASASASSRSETIGSGSSAARPVFIGVASKGDAAARPIALMTTIYAGSTP
jgi:hypothetical protein